VICIPNQGKKDNLGKPDAREALVRGVLCQNLRPLDHCLGDIFLSFLNRQIAVAKLT